MGKRSTARRLALQVLFAVDLGQAEISLAEENIFNEEKFIDDTMVFARQLAEGTVAHLKEIDLIISQQTIDWSLDRLGAVDRNVLRLAIFELYFQKDTPASVVINEAVELAKKFGSDESPKFINGILGALAKK